MPLQSGSDRGAAGDAPLLPQRAVPRRSSTGPRRDARRRHHDRHHRRLPRRDRGRLPGDARRRRAARVRLGASPSSTPSRPGHARRRRCRTRSRKPWCRSATSGLIALQEEIAWAGNRDAGGPHRRGAGRAGRGPQGRARPRGCPVGPATTGWCTSPSRRIAPGGRARRRRRRPGDLVSGAVTGAAPHQPARGRGRAGRAADPGAATPGRRPSRRRWSGLPSVGRLSAARRWAGARRCCSGFPADGERPAGAGRPPPVAAGAPPPGRRRDRRADGDRQERARGRARAPALGGEVVNADAIQLYRGMDIGTAKLTARRAPRRPAPPVRRPRPGAGREPGGLPAAARARSRRSPIAARCRSWPAGRGSTSGPCWIALVFPGTDPVIRAGLEAELEPTGAPALHARLADGRPGAAAAIVPATAGGWCGRWRSSS